jgi:hypothetical protein
MPRRDLRAHVDHTDDGAHRVRQAPSIELSFHLALEHDVSVLDRHSNVARGQVKRRQHFLDDVAPDAVIGAGKRANIE